MDELEILQQKYSMAMQALTQATDIIYELKVKLNFATKQIEELAKKDDIDSKTSD